MAIPSPSPRKASTPCWTSGRYSRRSRPLPRAASDAGRGKKRLRALAEWHFGGGESYCAACQGPCPDCPARLNRPLTLEGWQVWDLAQRLTGQLRISAGMGGAAILDWDMAAAFAMARALGVDPLIAAECLPEIEAVMVRKLNEQIAVEEKSEFRA